MKPQPESKDAGSIVAQPKKGRMRGLLICLPSKNQLRGPILIGLLLCRSAVRAKRANKLFTSYNLRTLNDTVCHNVTISHEIQQLINSCETNIIDILAIQEGTQAKGN